MDLKLVALPLYEARGWMKLLGVVLVITGILTALSIVGLIIAWLPIWLGVLLFQAAGRIELAFATDDEMSLRESLAKLKTFFVIQGVLLLIYLAVVVGAVGIAFLGGLASLAVIP
ncbi:MAG: hypothetical protein F4029_02500 [Gammaproteobacteria bacterium]|nr:DUF5362 family protein [Gammaproteobacteria bacterium]MXY58423.1 hypothetical protein [Gammaproteobacteria bacterium]MYF29499.1 hypothetical protein [Gammaproteobacteria bacterium]MYK45080.1 hypothetical protein [Gammaproteobacteria bacterium]